MQKGILEEMGKSVGGARGKFQLKIKSARESKESGKGIIKLMKWINGVEQIYQKKVGSCKIRFPTKKRSARYKKKTKRSSRGGKNCNKIKMWKMNLQKN